MIIVGHDKYHMVAAMTSIIWSQPFKLLFLVHIKILNLYLWHHSIAEPNKNAPSLPREPVSIIDWKQKFPFHLGDYHYGFFCSYSITHLMKVLCCSEWHVHFTLWWAQRYWNRRDFNWLTDDLWIHLSHIVDSILHIFSKTNLDS